jgi:hypothetical protein
MIFMGTYFKYLVELRDKGTINMCDAVPYLLKQFPELTEKVARKILADWMKRYTLTI